MSRSRRHRTRRLGRSRWSAVADGRAIAFVVPRYGEGIIGGAETLCRKVAEDLAAHGERVEVFTTCAIDHHTWANHLPAATTLERGVTVHRFPVSDQRVLPRFSELHGAINLGRHVDELDQLLWMGHSVWSPELTTALRVRDADLRCRIALPYLFGTTFWAAADAPERTLLVPCLHDEPPAKTPIVRRMLESVRGCIANAPAEIDLIHDLAPRARATLGGFGFEDPPTPPDPERFCRDRGIDGGYLLYAGRREEGKGLPLLYRSYARALGELEHVPPLALMGSGELPPPPEIAGHVIDLGVVPDAEKHDAMAAASVFVHPSRLESFGAVLAEAWLAGSAALVNGRSEVLRRHCESAGGGLWFNDEAEFVEALRTLLASPDLRTRLGAAGRAYVLREFSWSAVRGRYLDAIEAWS